MPANFDPPMRMPQIFLGVCLLGVSGLSSRQSLGQAIPVELSKETTFITEPLAEDGLPNFALAIVKRQRQGVTAENNGAVLFWQATGPGDMSAEHFALLCADLGIQVPAAPNYLASISSDETRQALIQWLSEKHSGAANGQTPADLEAAADRCLDAVQRRPWTADDLPPLADWVAENERPLNLLVAAAAKPRFFSPPPNVLENPKTPAFELSLPHMGNAREAARSLATRAMYHVGSRQYDLAWQDCLACWRLGEQIGSGPTSGEKLYGVSIRSLAKDSTIALLQATDIEASLLAKMKKDLDSLKRKIRFAESFRFSDRFIVIDGTLRVTIGRLGGVGEIKNDLPNLVYDSNIPLRMINEWFDRLADAAALEKRTTREAAIYKIYDEFFTTERKSNWQMLATMLSLEKRSEHLGTYMLALMAPSFNAMMLHQDRDETNLVLVRVAASLAIHRSRNNVYPDSLSELFPAIMSAIPTDPYTGQPLRYERRESGFLLYSVCKNLIDDGGLDLSNPIAKGEWLKVAEYEQPDIYECDLVVRVPMPKFDPAQWTLNDQSINSPAE